MTKSSPLIFFGNERLSTGLSGSHTPALNSLIEAGYRVVAIVASYSQGKSRSNRDLEVAEVANKHSIPLLLPSNLSEIKDQLKSYGAEVAVLAAYGQIIPQEILNIFPKGIINIHPSLLPKYRGSTPIETAILNGDSQTGVSIMRLSSKMDAGPVLAQEVVDIEDGVSKEELTSQLSDKGAELLLRVLPSVLDGSASPQKQDEAKASYSHLLKKTDGLVNWNSSAQVIERQVRAYQGYPKSTAKLFNKYDVILTNVRVASGQDDGKLVMECHPGWLEIVELIAPSGRTISGADFLRGYPT